MNEQEIAQKLYEHWLSKRTVVKPIPWERLAQLSQKFWIDVAQAFIAVQNEREQKPAEKVA